MKIKTFQIFILVILLNQSVKAQQALLDPNFGMNGIATTNGGFKSEEFHGIAVQPDGKIVGTGFLYDIDSIPPLRLTVARYNSDGVLDSTFGDNGITIGDSINSKGEAIVVQNNGKIWVAGYSNSSQFDGFTIYRFNIDGSKDYSFGSNGKMMVDTGSANCLAIQSDGKIVAGGYSKSNGDYSFMLVRIDTTGSLDSSFGNNGIVNTYLGNAAIKALVVQKDQKIVVGGGSLYGSTLVRYNTDGSLDSLFGTDGIVKSIFGSNLSSTSLQYLAIQSDDRILATAEFYYLAGGNYHSQIAVVRYDMNGNIDSTFGVAGIVTTIIHTSSYPYFVTEDMSGKIIVAGFSIDENNSYYYLPNWDFTLVCYNTNGSLDSAFGMNGILYTDIDNDESYDVCYDAVVIDGNIIGAGGTNNLSYDENYVLVKYLLSLNAGVFDPTCNAKMMMVYPNPIKGMETLQYKLLRDEEISISLLDIQGRLIQSILSKEKRLSGGHEEKFMLSNDLPSGSYLLSIETESRKNTIKIIKQ